jgi:signal transduction histidine kinase
MFQYTRQKGTMSGESILIADDSGEIRNLIADYLRGLGYRVQTASDGEKAVALIGAQSFDLVITDFQMPRLDGLGVLQAAKAHDLDIKVVILTGHPTAESAIGALRKGAYDYLLKPVENLDELGHLVENALTQRRLTLENRRLMEELRVLNANLANRVAQRTEQLHQAYDQLKSLHQMKAQFVSVTSHELRTPLTQILLTADLLKEQISRRSLSGAEVYLREMVSQSQRLQRLIDNLLDFSLMERNEFKLNLGECHLPALVRSTAELLRPRIEAKRLDLGLAVPDCDITLIADEPRLQNALGQLLENALKFTHPGGRIMVGVHGPTRAPWTEAASSPFAVIAVIDSGIGIPADQQQAIFESFTQVDMSDQRRYGGLGVGLTITARIVTAHGGRITLKSQPGKGSTFAMWLPMRAKTSPFVLPG